MSGYYRHTYDPGPQGEFGRPCQWRWTDSSGNDRICGSTQRSSVMHDDPEADLRQRHYHGGGDCMCFENDNDYLDRIDHGEFA